MKRSELPLLFPGIVLLLAAAAYALLFFTSRAEDVPSAVCTAALWQDTLSLKGVVSRGETSVSAPEGATLGLVPAAILAALLRGIAPEQLPAVAE